MTQRGAIQHLAWKEFSQQLPIWLTLMILNVITVTLLVATQDANLKPTIAILGITFATIYAVACSATLFSMEKELKTFYFVQNIPISPRLFGWTKIGVGFSLLLCFIIIAGVSTYFLVREWLAVAFSGGSLPTFVFFGYVLPPIELFGFTTLCSFFIRRTIVAAIAGVCLAGLVYFATGFFWYDSVIFNFGVRSVLCVLVIATNLYLASRWLTVGFETQQEKVSNRLQFARPGSRNLGIIHRLFWQTLREKAGTIPAGFAVMGISFLIGMLIIAISQKPDLMEDSNSFFSFLVLSGMIGISICASWTFAGDQRRNRKLFFVQQFETPRLIWLTRCSTQMLMTAISVLMVALLIVATIWYFDFSQTITTALWLLVEDSNTVGDDFGFEQLMTAPRNLAFALSALFAGFAVGQLASLLVRQPILSMVFAAFAAIGMFYWMVFVRELQFALWWSVWPVVGFLFLATFLFLPRWLRDADRGWQKLRPLGVAAVPFAAVLILMPTVRLQQVPNIPISEDTRERIQQLTSADAISAAEACYRGLEKYHHQLPDTPDNTIPWSERNFAEWDQAILDQFVQDTQTSYENLQIAEKAEYCYPFLEDFDESRRKQLELKKAYLVYGSRAEVELRKGNLAEAFAHYAGLRQLYQQTTVTNVQHSSVLHQLLDDVGRWASHPAMTHELLEKAIAWLQVKATDPGSYCDWYANYEFYDRSQSEKLSQILKPGLHAKPRTLLFFGWERERARRIGWILAERTGHFPPRYSEFEQMLRLNPAQWSNHRHGDKAAFAYAAAHEGDYPIFHKIRGSWSSWRDWSIRNHTNIYNANSNRLAIVLYAKMRLIEFRILNGAYPESLENVPSLADLKIDSPSNVTLSRPWRDSHLVYSKGFDAPVYLECTSINHELDLKETTSSMEHPIYVPLFKANEPFLLDFFYHPIVHRDEKTNQSEIRLRSYQSQYRLDQDDMRQLKYLNYANIYRLPKIKDDKSVEE